MKIGKLTLSGLLAAALGLGLAAGYAHGQAAATRDTLKTIEVAGTDREAAIGIATIPDGAGFARHYHPGEEMAVVIEGEVVVKAEGRPDQLLRVGDSFAMPRGVLHEAAPPPGKSARIIAVWITDKGQPRAIAAR